MSYLNYFCEGGTKENNALTLLKGAPTFSWYENIWQDGVYRIAPSDLVTADIANRAAFTLTMRTRDLKNQVDAHTATLDTHTALLAGFANQLSENGYQKLPGGLIIQWMNPVDSGDGNQDGKYWGTSYTTNFPIPFTQVFAVLISTVNLNDDQSVGNDKWYQVVSYTNSAVKWLLQAANDSTPIVNIRPVILAIGI